MTDLCILEEENLAEKKLSLMRVLTEGMSCLYHLNTTSMCSIIHKRLKKRPLQRRGDVQLHKTKIQ